MAPKRKRSSSELPPGPTLLKADTPMNSAFGTPPEWDITPKFLPKMGFFKHTFEDPALQFRSAPQQQGGNLTDSVDIDSDATIIVKSDSGDHLSKEKKERVRDDDSDINTDGETSFHPRRRFGCNHYKCFSTFDSYVALHLHLDRKHLHDGSGLRCPRVDCDKEFTSRNRLAQHLRTQEHFVCSSCISKFGTEEEVAMHLREFGHG
ncbi:hypothetical protein EJ08DRAFT_698955 [Tothia fuscella]|uniref:C2H2-type domain-containing protein n=1 Tax=Tothia fuscella TaxID=1048955 RepID=A0A9P4NNQ6_9PEZI|nr:hypothetical protein EJ08DRAFT_698955 [Tothia fuscella]